ncbi:MAG: 4Fe-4S dicluster domain-containing protein [Desulfobacteraceae bacterium]|nr:4Fe-4S dicluster domain-containing protein [Desulfobacteraceae bacterium]
MKVIKIDKSQWSQTLEKIRGAYRLFGPVKEKTFHNFTELSDGQSPDLAFQNTRLSPKSLVFPQSEVMLNYSLDEADADHHVPKEAPKDYSPRAVIGIRPCDAKALALVKMNFDTDQYKDPYWLNLYNATTFVGLACDAPCGTCFCTTAGCGPFSEEGLDVLLVDQNDHYVAKALTDKGTQLLQKTGSKETTAAAIETAKIAAEAKITAKIETDNLRGADMMALYKAGLWEDISFACLNCGTCTFSCPTCWCFDIQDEVYRKKGVRMRNWDSCMFPIFSVHTTGHNPRDSKLSRVRQRFMHKLKYFVDKYDKGIMCVGCGRCVRQCPVNIDIRKVSALMNQLGSEARCAVKGS